MRTVALRVLRKRLTVQEWPKKLSRVACFAFCHNGRGTFHDDSSAPIATLGPKIDNPVRGRDQLDIVLD